MMQGNVLGEGFRNNEVKEALDLCLSCKACKTECPVNVDIATWKSEFLAHHYAGKLHPLHHYDFWFMDRRAKMAYRIPLYLEQRAKGAGGWPTMPKWTHSRLYGQSAN
jgi:Fe-S oxidoreductase